MYYTYIHTYIDLAVIFKKLQQGLYVAWRNYVRTKITPSSADIAWQSTAGQTWSYVHLSIYACQNVAQCDIIHVCTYVCYFMIILEQVFLLTYTQIVFCTDRHSLYVCEKCLIL